MGKIIDFPRQKPRPDQLELPRVKLYEALENIKGLVLRSQGALMDAQTAEDLAINAQVSGDELRDYAEGFADLVDITRDWLKK